MSPKATTSSSRIPSSSQSAASVVALVTPAALISTSAPTEDQVVVTRWPTSRSVSAQNSWGSRSSCRASSLTVRSSKISSSGPTWSSGGRSWRSMNRGSRPKPVVFSSANVVPGMPSRISRATCSPVSTGIGRQLRTARAWTSYTMPPLEQIASPWSPTCSHRSCIQRIGRPVTKTTVTPSSSTAVSTSRVRAVTVPSACSRVPSRSVATRRIAGPGTRLRTSARARRRRRRCTAVSVTSSAASWTSSGAWPMATPRPAQRSISMSLRPSPIASTSAGARRARRPPPPARRPWRRPRGRCRATRSSR